MKLSVIIPAYNEEKYLGKTLESVKTALSGTDDAEIVVVDNESIDATRQIAADHGARLVTEQIHNISKVRNTGARNAAGNIFVFIDADTLVPPGLFEKIVEIMTDDSCFGGSVAVEYGEAGRKWIRYYLMGWQFWGRVLKMRQGAAQFCRKSAFHALGGYDTTIFMGEDVEFQWRLRKLARESGTGHTPLPKRSRDARVLNSAQPDNFEPLPLNRELAKGYTTHIEHPHVLTSARRYDKMGLIRTLILTHPITLFLFWRTRAVWKDWYENAVR